jgi:hypothetical protein
MTANGPITQVPEYYQYAIMYLGNDGVPTCTPPLTAYQSDFANGTPEEDITLLDAAHIMNSIATDSQSATLPVSRDWVYASIGYF